MVQFAELFGDDLIQYYYDEKYLVDKNREVYDSLIKKVYEWVKTMSDVNFILREMTHLRYWAPLIKKLGLVVSNQLCIWQEVINIIALTLGKIKKN